MAFPGAHLENRQPTPGETCVTLFDDPDLTPDDYTWSATWYVDGSQIVPAIASVVVVKGGSPAPFVKGHTGGSRAGSNLSPAPTITLTYPSYVAGDLVIVWASHSSTSTGMGIPAGWTNLFSHGGLSEQLRCWCRVMTGSEGATLTLSSSSSLTQWAAAMAVIGNPHGMAVTAIDDVDVHHDSVNTSPVVAGPATVTVNGGLALPCYCVDPVGAFHNARFQALSKTGGAVPIVSFDLAADRVRVW